MTLNLLLEKKYLLMINQLIKSSLNYFNEN